MELSRRHLDGRDVPDQGYDPLCACPNCDITKRFLRNARPELINIAHNAGNVNCNVKNVRKFPHLWASFGHRFEINFINIITFPHCGLC